MPRFVIERNIPAMSTAEREALREAAHKSNTVLAEVKAERQKRPVGAQLCRWRQNLLHLSGRE